MTERVTDKIKKAVDMILDLDYILYVEIRLANIQSQQVWDALNELKIFNIENIYVKVMVDDTECRVIIGAGRLINEV